MDPVLTWSFLAIGVFGQGGAAMLARRPIALLRAGGKAVGTVTGSDAQTVSSSKGPARTYHLPRVAFTTAKGEKIEFKSISGGTTPPVKGSTVDVIYDPANPHEAEIKSGIRLWLFPAALSLMSLPFLLVGVSGLLSR